MATADILSELQRLGVELEADGERLRLRPRGAVPPKLRKEIIRHKDELLAHARKSENQSNLTPTAAEPCLPEVVLTARYPLAVLCRTAVDSLPTTHKLSADERRCVAEHLEKTVLGWLAHVFKPEYAWRATCPKGHQITEGVFARCLLGWCCPECRQVFPASECRLQIGEGR